MEFGIEKSAMSLMISGKRLIMEGFEQTNKVVIRTVGEKETYKYLGLLEADTIKQQEMKEKIKRSISEEPDKTLYQKPYQRDKFLDCPHRKILRNRKATMFGMP